jgi:hypothetical protein
MATNSKRPQAISEKLFLQQVRDLARLLGWLQFHVHDARRSPAGFPDLVLVKSPSVLFIELKSSSGRLRPAQRVWLSALEQCPGVEAHVWRPRDWPEIVSRLQKKRDTPTQCGTSRHQNGQKT